jgi:hypothetical protein
LTTPAPSRWLNTGTHARTHRDILVAVVAVVAVVVVVRATQIRPKLLTFHATKHIIIATQQAPSRREWKSHQGMEQRREEAAC